MTNLPKYRKKALYPELRRELGPILKELAERTGCEIIEGHLLLDHVHILISIPPKYAVSDVVGFMKGKSAIEIAKLMGRKRNFSGQSFWARGYFVSTVGLDRLFIQAYIRDQEDGAFCISPRKGIFQQWRVYACLNCIDSGGKY